MQMERPLTTDYANGLILMARGVTDKALDFIVDECERTERHARGLATAQ